MESNSEHVQGLDDADRAMNQAEELGRDVAERIERKYVAGQQEHGGNLDESGVHALCGAAEEEVLDLAAYLWHLRRALKEQGRASDQLAAERRSLMIDCEGLRLRLTVLAAERDEAVEARKTAEHEIGVLRKELERVNRERAEDAAEDRKAIRILMSDGGRAG